MRRIVKANLYPTGSKVGDSSYHGARVVMREYGGDIDVTAKGWGKNVHPEAAMKQAIQNANLALDMSVGHNTD